MSKTQIITDTTCDIDASLLVGRHLEILPLTVVIDQKSYLDGEEITVGDVYNWMRSGILPKTSQIPYERTHDLFKRILDEGKDLIYITFSSEMSGCYTLGGLVAEELKREYPNRKIAVLDSLAGSGGLGLIVLQALRMAEAGEPFETLVSQTRFMIEHIEHVFSVDDLEWLAKGGRIPKLVGYIGSKLGIHPILDVEKGRMIVRRMVRGKKNAIQALSDEIVKRASKFPVQLISITHGDDLPSAQTLEQLVKKAMPDCLTTICHIGGVLGVHIGLKGIGVFCFTQKPARYCMV